MPFCDTDQGCRGVHVDSSRHLGDAIDRRRDDRGKVNDRLGSNVGNQALNLVRIRQIGPSGFGTFGELRGFFAVGGGVEVSGDDTTAELGQLSHSGRTDKAEPAGDEHDFSQQPPSPRI